MATQKYNGILGKFEYDDSVFEISVRSTVRGDFEYLKYIGPETDGSKIILPKGIKNTRYMFLDNKTLESGVDIPRSVTETSFMYSGCDALKAPSPFLSKAVVKSDGMYKGCSSLEYATYIEREPESHVNMFMGVNAAVSDGFNVDMKYSGDELFKLAVSFASGRVFSNRTKGMDDSFIHYSGGLGEFDYDPNTFTIGIANENGKSVECLKYIGNITDGRRIKIPEGVVDLSHTFEDCNLSVPPRIPEGVKKLSYTFYGNPRLTDYPVIPESVVSAAFMIDKKTEKNLSASGKGYKKRLFNFDNRGEAWNKSDEFYTKHYEGPKGNFDYDNRNFGFVDMLTLSTHNKKQGEVVDFSDDAEVSYVLPESDNPKYSRSLYLVIDDKLTVIKPGIEAKVPAYAKEALDEAYADNEKRRNDKEYKSSLPFRLRSQFRYIGSDKKDLSDVVVPAGITDISNMFSYMSNMERGPKFENNGESIINMSHAFYGCKNLKKIFIPDNVKDLSYAFYDCKAFYGRVNMPNSVEKADYAFCNCEHLQSISTLPNNDRFTSMNGIFMNCSSITRFCDIPDTVISAKNAFYGCGNLLDCGRLSDNLVDATRMFKGCVYLNKVVDLPSTLKEASSMYQGCYALPKCPVIPASVENTNNMVLGCNGKVKMQFDIQSATDRRGTVCTESELADIDKRFERSEKRKAKRQAEGTDSANSKSKKSRREGYPISESVADDRVVDFDNY